MAPSGFGDLARTMPLASRGVQARADLSRLSNELTTGRRTDVAAGARGDLRPLAGVERSIAMLGRHEAAALSAQGRMEVMQTVLDGMQKSSQRAASDLLLASDSVASVSFAQAEDLSRSALGSALSALGTRFGGVHVFSGAATDTPALPGMEDMLTALRADPDVGAAADPAALRAAVQAWFAPAGGLDAGWPLDGSDEAAVLSIAPGETLTVEARAADPAIRSTLADLALGVLASEAGSPFDDAGRREALGAAAQGLFGDEAGLAVMRGRLGAAEGQSERALVRVRAESDTLEIARGKMVEVDRYETATQLQAAQAGVETLYLVTARLSSLSLTNYLR